MTCPENVTIDKLPVTECQISFTDGRQDVIVQASPAGDERFMDLGDIPVTGGGQVDGSLKWTGGRQFILSGRIGSEVEGEVQV